MQSPTMRGKDMINTKFGTVIFEIEGKRFVAFNLVNFKATVKNDVKALGVMDRYLSVHMSTGGEGTFEGEAYGAQPYFLELLKAQKDKLKTVPFIIQTDEHDPAYEGGRQTIIFTGCLLNEHLLTILDAEGGERKEPCSGTFDDFMTANEYHALQAANR